MPRYIDADNVLDNFECNGECLNCQFNADPFCYVKGLIASEPDADVREEKHGHWIFIGTISDGEDEHEVFRCSECIIPNDKTSRFCPNCGAIMDEKIA